VNVDMALIHDKNYIKLGYEGSILFFGSIHPARKNIQVHLEEKNQKRLSSMSGFGSYTQIQRNGYHTNKNNNKLIHIKTRKY
jgi:hypothetical protein